jgi:hypothetical protein
VLLPDLSMVELSSVMITTSSIFIVVSSPGPRLVATLAV